MIYQKWGNIKFKYRNREFWYRGYYADTTRKDAKKIQAYIQNQLKEDQLDEQLTFDTKTRLQVASNSFSQIPDRTTPFRRA